MAACIFFDQMDTFLTVSGTGSTIRRGAPGRIPDVFYIARVKEMSMGRAGLIEAGSERCESHHQSEGEA
ncbi:conserved hypothetical protein [Ricinus communis]|uniref:Uncharacterized protein n=1 Tax=Ricinus communis TaxID=3988 RepID=B9T936_RICCO|nr:conserved hypothetical protein [Ricinus communis]